jgi:hypothetical protein
MIEMSRFLFVSYNYRQVATRVLSCYVHAHETVKKRWVAGENTYINLLPELHNTLFRTAEDSWVKKSSPPCQTSEEGNTATTVQREYEDIEAFLRVTQV